MSQYHDSSDSGPSVDDDDSSVSLGEGVSHLTRSNSDLRTQLHQCFTSAYVSGTFASSATVDTWPNPALFVRDVGYVGLPLADPTALKAVAQKAPFGQGESTFVDETVRKTWEIDASRLQIGNPQWHNFIQGTVVPVVTTAIGVAGSSRTSTRAELYKLLLYEEGAMFKPHRDTPKVPGMYGTLVISLPSPHTGGDVILRHDNRSIQWQSCTYPIWVVSFCAWYADVEHEVLPVTSGCRLVLTYNLIDTAVTSEKSCVKVVTSPDQRLATILNCWQRFTPDWKNKDNSDYLCYALKHKYTDNSLTTGMQALKGPDAMIVSQTARTADVNGFSVFLATVQKCVTGEVDGGERRSSQQIVDVTSIGWNLRLIVSLDGREYARDVPMEESQMIQEDFFNSAHPSKIEPSTFQGNYGSSAVHWYRSSVMVIMRDKDVVPTLLKTSLAGHTTRDDRGIKDRLSLLIENCMQRQGDPKSASMLSAACRAVHQRLVQEDYKDVPDRWSTTRMKRVFDPSDDDLAYIAYCACYIGNSVIFHNMIGRLKHLTLPSMQSFAAVLAPRVLLNFEQSLSTLVTKTDGPWQKLLNAVTFEQAWRLRCNEPAACAALPIVERCSDILFERASQHGATGEDDGVILAIWAKNRRAPVLGHSVLPYLERVQPRPQFVIGFFGGEPQSAKDSVGRATAPYRVHQAA
ncbi:hypothetical protein BDZ85DRAFT_84715 [Elsinoe ampelina]|uniref:Fe2OG dioxygenase domain-containing protein n=1 Tax=Elsinoe ampelina TaxID=302913 RepID=A0A6A6GH62_9PEZI|nr:hypothetical protein BDZ85DRAFT_84715 [Elsinoe ampelina]